MEHVGENLTWHALIQLASSQISQNARQLADDMYVEVIYICLYFFETAIFIFSYKTHHFATTNSAVGAATVPTTLLSRAHYSFLRLNLSCVPDNRLTSRLVSVFRRFFFCPLTLEVAIVWRAKCPTLAHLQIHHSSGRRHRRHTLWDTRHICDHFQSGEFWNTARFFLFPCAWKKKHYFMSMHLLEN